MQIDGRIGDKDFFLRELSKRTDKAVAKRLTVSIAGIAGCGGIGSNIAISLTRAGIKKLVLVDFDKVAISDLNRQQYFVEDIGNYKVDALSKILLRINPYLELEKYAVEVTSDNLFILFSEVNIIFEAFDDVGAKSMIINAFLDKYGGNKFLVCASGMAGVMSSNLIQTKRLNDKVYVCGDFVSDADCGLGLLSSRVSITANHQVSMGIRLLTGITEP